MGIDRWAFLGAQDSQLYCVQHGSQGSGETETALRELEQQALAGAPSAPRALRGLEKHC